MLNKKLPLEVIRDLSARRSEQYYLKGVGLPAPLPKAAESQEHLERPSQEGTRNTDNDKVGLKSPLPTRVSEPGLILTPTETHALSYVVKEPIPATPQSQVYRVLETKSGSLVSRTQARLLASGFINLHRIQIGKTYMVLWVASDRAFSYLKLPKPHHATIGGYLHAWIVQQVCSALESEGWKTTAEFKLMDGSLTDIVACRDSETRCFEIGLPPLLKEVQNGLKNVTSELNPQKVIHVVKDSRDKHGLEKLISADPRLEPFLTRIEVVLTGTFLNQSKQLPLLEES